jgi:p38 MAP kinase
MTSTKTKWHKNETEKFDCELPDRYKKLAFCGKSDYGGIVFKAADEKSNNKRVLIKKFSQLDDVVQAKNAYREIKLIKHVRHDNLPEFHDLFSNSISKKSLKDM